MSQIIKMTGLDIRGKRLLIREDLNVPVSGGKVSSDSRLRAALPTIQHGLESGAAVILMSHLGRPVEGNPEEKFSLTPVAEWFSTHTGRPVRVVHDYLEHSLDLQQGELCLLENVRFNAGEKDNQPELAQRYAALCDVFVMDAFGTAHRAQASTHGVAKFADIACAGPLLMAELEALSRALEQPARPTVSIVGGAKVSTKLAVLDSLSSKVDRLLPGGGIANTFIAAMGHNVGKSLYEPKLNEEARKLILKMQERSQGIPIPTDVVVGKAFDVSTSATVKSVNDIGDDDMIFDIGPQTAAHYAAIIAEAGTIVWNGPVGVFEFEQFSEGTRVLGKAIANSAAFSIAGGGDTLAAVDQFDLTSDISYISTGGGAFLEFLEGKTLPAVDILQRRADTV